MCKIPTMFLLSIPLVQAQHMYQVFTSSWHSLVHFTGHASAFMTRNNILKRTSNFWKPLIKSQKKNGQQYKRWRLCLLVLQNTPCLRLKCPASSPHESSTCAKYSMSYCENYLFKYWSTVIDLKQQPLTRTSSCIGILAVSVNVMRVQIIAECVSWSRWRHVCPVKLFWLFWLYSCKFYLQQLPIQSLTLKFMTKLLTSFWTGYEVS